MVHNSSEQKDYITGFAFEREFVGDYPNCLSNKTSEVTIVAGTFCKVFQLGGGEIGASPPSLSGQIRPLRG